MTTIDDEIKALLSGNQIEVAYDRVYTVLGPEIRGYLRGVTNRIEDGDDLFQELCLAVWQQLPRFRHGSSMRTWVYAIAHNLFVDYLARPSRKRLIELSTGRLNSLPERSLSSLMEWTQKERVLDELKERLSPEDRELIILRAERECSYQMLTEILGGTEQAIRQRYHRVKQQLRDLVSVTQSQ